MTNPNPDPAKHKDITIWNAEDWLYEDFEVGQTARSIRRTISEGESMMFNAIVLDMHPYVADDVFVFGEDIIRNIGMHIQHDGIEHHALPLGDGTTYRTRRLAHFKILIEPVFGIPDGNVLMLGGIGIRIGHAVLLRTAAVAMSWLARYWSLSH